MKCDVSQYMIILDVYLICKYFPHMWKTLESEWQLISIRGVVWDHETSLIPPLYVSACTNPIK